MKTSDWGRDKNQLKCLDHTTNENNEMSYSNDKAASGNLINLYRQWQAGTFLAQKNADIVLMQISASERDNREFRERQLN